VVETLAVHQIAEQLVQSSNGSLDMSAWIIQPRPAELCIDPAGEGTTLEGGGHSQKKIRVHIGVLWARFFHPKNQFVAFAFL